MKVSITIPVYNEEESIGKTVINLVNEFKKNNEDYQLVLVNHGSEDNSGGVLKKLAKNNKRLKVINLKKNLGYGGGIMCGFDHSDGEYVGFTCADEEVSAQDVYRTYSILKNGDYNVSKTRRMNRKDGNFRKFTSFVFNSLISLRFNLDLKDINGYPIFMKKDLFPLVKTKEKTYLFNLDFLRKIKRGKYRIIEVPVVHKKREEGHSYMKLSRIFNMTFGFLRYILKMTTRD